MNRAVKLIITSLSVFKIFVLHRINPGMTVPELLYLIILYIISS
jgi:hypothetical protein